MVDGSDWVIVAVLPDQAAAVLSGLTFRPNQLVISLVAGLSHAELHRLLCPALPPASIVRAVPLPQVAAREGVSLIHPPHPGVAALFGALGTAVEVKTEAEMAKLQVMTAMMGQYYTMLQTAVEFLGEGEGGVDAPTASAFTGSLFASVAADAGRRARAAAAVGDGTSFERLIEEQTPGGYNEQGMRELREAGVFGEIKRTMRSLDARWAGRPHER